MTDTDTIIDAVILWVDGNDEKHRQKNASLSRGDF